MSFKKSIEAVWEGGMRFRALTGSGHEVASDDGQSDTAPRPTELVLSALVMCTAMDIVSILDKKRQDYERYLIHATSVQREEYPQVLSVIEVVHVIEGTVVLEHAVRRAIELSATKYCPVNAMLSAGATEVHHGYRIRNTSSEPFEAESEVVVTGPYRRPDMVE